MDLQGCEKVHAEYLKENLPARYLRLLQNGQLEKVCQRQAQQARDFEDAHRKKLNPGQISELIYDQFLTPPIPTTE